MDKPEGLTSHDVVSRVRKLANTRKVGHAGTLDPMATGLLTLGLNSSTRLLTFLVGLDKEYFATIRLGETTDTDDAQGASTGIADPASVAAVTEAAVREAIVPLTGPISQVPSSVSAIRVDGRHAYELARAGETVVLKSRDVTVSTFEILDIRRSTSSLDVDVRVECSSGTYIRALARDLGAALGLGGHLIALRRTRVGPFTVAAASTMEHLDPVGDLVPPERVAATLFPLLQLDAVQVLGLSQGKRLPGFPTDGGPIAAISPEGRLAGLVNVIGGVAKPIVNFPTSEVLPQ
ncbi:tRNA pseudouridine synthase B [Glaciihabitans tibetensis]|uniref:tRNA pseudouridine synthase B n=1 Tax=Glaciihabitans tibetensis TaxID=1266600 RepID=A0A2T0VHG1_9MICO|nr:tRNA pseudouridine synthase B [Glaciihabitans tibetensis]